LRHPFFYSNASVVGFIYFLLFLRSRGRTLIVFAKIFRAAKNYIVIRLYIRRRRKKSVFIYNIFFWPSFVKSDFAFYHFNGFPSSCSIKLITEHSPLSFVSVCEGVIVITIIIIIITVSVQHRFVYYVVQYNI